MAMYPTTQPAEGDTQYDLVGKLLQAFNAANGTGGAAPAGKMYSTCDPTQGDELTDRIGKFLQAYNTANGN